MRTDRRPHQAVGAVAAQHVGGLDGLLAAAHPVEEAHPHPAGPVLGDAGDLDIAPQHDVRIPLEVRPQHAFQLGLVEHVHLGVAVGAGLRAALQLRQHPHVGVQHPKTQRGPAVGGELVADAQAGQDAVDLVVGVHRARQRVDGFMAVEHQTRNAVLAKQVAAVMPVGPAPTMITGTKSGSDAGAPLDCAFMRIPPCCVAFRG